MNSLLMPDGFWFIYEQAKKKSPAQENLLTGVAVLL